MAKSKKNDDVLARKVMQCKSSSLRAVFGWDQLSQSKEAVGRSGRIEIRSRSFSRYNHYLS